MVWYAPRRYAQDVCINSKMLRKTGLIAHVIFLDSSSIRLRSPRLDSVKRTRILTIELLYGYDLAKKIVLLRRGGHCRR